MKLPEDDWLVKTYSFLTGDLDGKLGWLYLMFIGWQRNNQISMQSIISLKSRKNIFKKSEFYNLTLIQVSSCNFPDSTLNHVFDTHIIAYCL